MEELDNRAQLVSESCSLDLATKYVCYAIYESFSDLPTTSVSARMCFQRLIRRPSVPSCDSDRSRPSDALGAAFDILKVDTPGKSEDEISVGLVVTNHASRVPAVDIVTFPQRGGCMHSFRATFRETV